MRDRDSPGLPARLSIELFPGPNLLLQEMISLRLESDDIVAGVGGFDAEEAVISLIGQVGEALRFFNPGIPHHGGAAA